MYANDTTILISSSSIIDLMAESVNILTKFSFWICANKLALNDKKTKYVIFSSSVISYNDHTNWLVFDSHTVTCSDFVCYLGIIIDQYLSWFEHFNAVRNKLAKGVGMLHVIHNYLPSECLLSVYNAFCHALFNLLYRAVGQCMYYIFKSYSVVTKEMYSLHL